jgi:hypothetical protein
LLPRNARTVEVAVPTIFGELTALAHVKAALAK